MAKELDFSSFEKRLLTELVDEFGAVIESKLTDSNTLHKKDVTWVV